MLDLSLCPTNYIKYKWTEYDDEMTKILDWILKNHKYMLFPRGTSKHKYIGKLKIR